MKVPYEKVGNDKVMISAKDFEDMLDALAFDEATANAGEFFPLEMVNRMIDGESPLKVFREYRSFSQKQLADKAGVSQTTVAEIEGGRKRGSVETLKALAEALDVAIDDLV